VNSSEWQATAEIVATTIAVVGFLAGLFLRLLQTRFVTRKEHIDLCGRVDGVEIDMSKTVKKEDLSKLSDRLYGVEENLAETNSNLAKTNGLLEGNTNSNKALASQINILIEAGLERKRS
jgi:hypothetical protein